MKKVTLVGSLLVAIITFAPMGSSGQAADEDAALARVNSAINASTALLDGAPVGSAGVLIAEGDSWFAYPGTNLVKELERLGFAVFSTAENGARLEEMAYSTDRLIDLRGEMVKAQRQYEEELPRALILSGGGNDVVHESLWLMLNHASSGYQALNDEIVTQHIDVRLQTALRTWIIQARALLEDVYGGAASDVPIFIHGYDHAIPDGRGYRRFLKTWRGPWIEPGLIARGHGSLDENPGNQLIIEELIQRFNAMLEEVANDLDPLVRYVSFIDELDGTLANDAYRDDWDNELHPTDEAFRHLAVILAREIGL